MSKLEDQFANEIWFYGAALPKFERQYKFDPGRRWKFDFAWPDLRIAIEIQGGIYVQGRHSRGAAMEQEYEKLNAATKAGWRVFLFGPGAVKQPKRGSSRALEVMWEVLHERSDQGVA